MKKLMFFILLVLVVACTPKEHKAAEVSGIWSIDYFVDSFGDKTNNPYVRSEEITGLYQRYSNAEATLGVLVSQDDHKQPVIGLRLNSEYDVIGGFMDDFTIKVSGEGFESIVFRSTYNDDLRRFVVKGDNAKKLLDIFSTANSCEIKGVHEGFLMNTSFSFQIDSLAGLPAVHKMYKSLLK